MYISPSSEFVIRDRPYTCRYAVPSRAVRKISALNTQCIEWDKIQLKIEVRIFKVGNICVSENVRKTLSV
jgi:hypothetical protein